MLALVYLAIVITAGDALAGRWFRYVSWSHRVATAILVGLPIGAFASYLVALALQDLDSSLLIADAVVAIALLGLIVVMRFRRPATPRAPTPPTNRWDAMTIIVTLAVTAWMMFLTYTFANGTLGIAGGIWSDFGPTSAIAQSFAVGHNFPTEYPHFAHESIRYHFMFWFQVGNLTHLGLNPALANNVLSVATLVSMLVLVMALGNRLFRSYVVGRIGALLFLVHGSLSFIPLVANYSSMDEALDRLWNLTAFVASAFPYRGEEWGIWTQMVFLNQRHLASAIGLILVVVLFLLGRRNARRQPTGSREVPGEAPVWSSLSTPGPATGPVPAAVPPTLAPATPAPVRSSGLAWRVRNAFTDALHDAALPGYVFCGFLAGLLPLWNGAIYVAAGAVLATWLLLFPNRIQMLALGATAAVVSLPQILFVQPGNLGGEATFPRFHWGYTIENAGLVDVAIYLGFIFGPKLLLAAVALVRATARQWGVFVCFTGLLGVAFLIQLSVEVFANHKFINTWLVVLNLFAAAGMVGLWRLRGARRIPARLVAAAIAAIIVAGGLIDFMPIKNQGRVELALDGDRLYEWVRTQTDEGDVFLSDLYVAHPILLAGRSIYYGWPYYAWSAGYDVGPREREYRDLFLIRSPRELVRRLQEDGIAYVAVDDGLRQQSLLTEGVNEDVYRAQFAIAFDDLDNRYGNLVIYRVPTEPGAWQALPAAPPVDAFTGGAGGDPGRFNGPRGIAVGGDGTIAVADTLNHRIQLFEPDGTFRAELGQVGRAGAAEGQFNEPYGVALDAAGRVWVVDSHNHRLVELDPAGTVLNTWTGPEPGFYGPRDVTIGPGGDVFVLDQGRARVVRRGADGTVTTYGSFGTADGQLNDPTGVAVDAERLYVADTGNARIVVFELAGDFVTAWPIDGWQQPFVFPDVAVDALAQRLYASNPATGQILAFELATFEPLGALAPATGVQLIEPGSLAPSQDTLLVLDAEGNRIVTLETGG